MTQHRAPPPSPPSPLSCSAQSSLSSSSSSSSPTTAARQQQRWPKFGLRHRRVDLLFLVAVVLFALYGGADVGFVRFAAAQTTFTCAPGQFRGYTVPGRQSGQSWCTLFDSSVPNAPTDANVTSLTLCCGNCQLGSYNPNGVGPCTSCPTGRYQNATGQSSCRACEAGKYNNVLGATACFECPAGKCIDCL